MALDGRHAGHVRGYGPLVVVAVDSLPTLRALVAGLDSLPGPPPSLPSRAPTVDLRVRGVSVARLSPDDADASPLAGRLARAVGVDGARVSLGGLVRTTLRRFTRRRGR